MSYVVQPQGYCQFYPKQGYTVQWYNSTLEPIRIEITEEGAAILVRVLPVRAEERWVNPFDPEGVLEIEKE